MVRIIMFGYIFCNHNSYYRTTEIFVYLSELLMMIDEEDYYRKSIKIILSFVMATVVIAGNC